MKVKYCCNGFDDLVMMDIIIRRYKTWLLSTGEGHIYVNYCPCCGKSTVGLQKEEDSVIQERNGR